MVVSISKSGLKQTAWYEYAIRFVLGGAVTVAAHVIGKEFSHEYGGLFLAFPAILAASTTLVEKHERQRQEQKGILAPRMGRRAAGADAAGAAMGSIGLMAFAVFVWKVLPEYGGPASIAGATLLWAVLCFLVWSMWRRNIFHRLRHHVSPSKRLQNPSSHERQRREVARRS